MYDISVHCNQKCTKNGYAKIKYSHVSVFFRNNCFIKDFMDKQIRSKHEVFIENFNKISFLKFKNVLELLATR